MDDHYCGHITFAALIWPFHYLYYTLHPIVIVFWHITVYFKKIVALTVIGLVSSHINKPCLVFYKNSNTSRDNIVVIHVHVWCDIEVHVHADPKNVICILYSICDIVEKLKFLVFYSLCDKHCTHKTIHKLIHEDLVCMWHMYRCIYMTMNCCVGRGGWVCYHFMPLSPSDQVLVRDNVHVQIQATIKNEVALKKSTTQKVSSHVWNHNMGTECREQMYTL